MADLSKFGIPLDGNKTRYASAKAIISFSYSV